MTTIFFKNNTEYLLSGKYRESEILRNFSYTWKNQKIVMEFHWNSGNF